MLFQKLGYSGWGINGKILLRTMKTNDWEELQDEFSRQACGGQNFDTKTRNNDNEAVAMTHL